MAERILAHDLAVGDIYRTSRGRLFPEPVGDAYRVAAIRTLRTVETYRVIEARNLRTGLGAQINLRADVEVFKLEPQPRRDIVGLLDYLPDGESVTVVRAGGAFYA